MENTLSHTHHHSHHYWGIPLTLGLIFIISGLGIIFLPFSTYYALSILCSISFTISGIVEITMGLTKMQFPASRGWRITGGLADMFIGIILYPSISPFGLSFLVAITLMFRSLMMIGLSFSLRLYDRTGWLWLFVTSIISLCLAILLLWNPVITSFTIGTFTGMAFLGVGIFILLFSFRLRHSSNIKI